MYIPTIVFGLCSVPPLAPSVRVKVIASYTERAPYGVARTLQNPPFFNGEIQGWFTDGYNSIHASIKFEFAETFLFEEFLTFGP